MLEVGLRSGLGTSGRTANHLAELFRVSSIPNSNLSLFNMFEFNPPHLPDAWWQDLLILLIPGLIGYIEGMRYATRRVTGMKVRLGELDESLRESHEIMFNISKVGTEESDDFKVIEGICPQVEKKFHRGGIRKYRELGFDDAGKDQ